MTRVHVTRFLVTAMTLGISACAGHFGQGVAMPDMPLEPVIQQALETKPSNEPVSWTGSDGLSKASVTPIATYQQDDGTYCRRYRVLREYGSEAQRATVGLRCRDAQTGTWLPPAGDTTQAANTAS